MARLFKLRLRPGRSLHSFGLNPNVHHRPGDEITVPENIAAELLRAKSAELIEVVEDGQSEDEVLQA